MSFSRLRFSLSLLAHLTSILVVGSEVRAASGSHSADGLWTELDRDRLSSLPDLDFTEPAAFAAFELGATTLERLLDRAPSEGTMTAKASPTIMSIPMPDGAFARFTIVESPILSSELAAQHRELRTFLGQGLDDPAATLRFDVTPLGFHAQILSPRGIVLVDPLQAGFLGTCISYHTRDLETPEAEFHCTTLDDQAVPGSPRVAAPTGDKLYTYRLALTATGEYTTNVGGIPQAMAQMTTTVNRIVGIYETEVAIRLQIVAFNIYANINTDPFPTGGVIDGKILQQNHDDLIKNVGAANFDIGHVLTRGNFGGVASIASVCNDLKKGFGVSGNSVVTGDAYARVMAHEMGHQFGALHTFNNSCNGTRDDRLEPGSGTTLMSYAGICAPNVQATADFYFHGVTFGYINWHGEGDCGQPTNTVNTPPTVDAGQDGTIPRDTPFTLKPASSGDADGDPLTYCWEQIDAGTGTEQTSPLFRSRPPTFDASRTCPPMSDVLNGTINMWELLPSVNRQLNFRCTVRDNRAGGGGVNSDDVRITVSGAPFRLTFPNGGQLLAPGVQHEVTWDRGGGTGPAQVQIWFSADGGVTWQSLTTVPNNGSAMVFFPLVQTTQGRIKIEALGPVVFFDTSDIDFTVDGAPPGQAVTTAGSGNWSSLVAGAPWPNGFPPNGTQDVTIADGHTVTLDVDLAACRNLTVGQGTSGVLEFRSNPVASLIARGNVTVANGAALRTAAAGTLTTHIFFAFGNITNNGTFDLSTNNGQAGAALFFFGSAPQTLSGAGATTDLYRVNVAKYSSGTVQFSPDNLTIEGGATAPFLSLSVNGGILRLSGTYALSSPIFVAANYTIQAGSGLWLDNPNITVPAQSAAATVAGSLRISAGTYNVGTGVGHSLGFASGSSVTIEGGALNVAGSFGVNASDAKVTYAQSSGTITVATQGHGSANVASFDLGTLGASSASVSGGSIVLQKAGSAGSGPRDYRVSTGTQALTGGTLQLGNANSGAAKTFHLTGSIANLVVDNSSAGHSGKLLAETQVTGTTTIAANATLDLNGFTLKQLGATFTNDGTLDGRTTNSRLRFQGAVGQTYAGQGSVASALDGLVVNNSAGLTIDNGVQNNIVARRVSLLRGVLTGSGKVTLGAGGTSSATTQIGGPNVDGSVGSFDAAPTFDIGTGGYAVVYLVEDRARTTSHELPATRQVKDLTIANPAGVTLAGGDLSVTGTLTLYAGLLTTSANNKLKLAKTAGRPAGSETSYVNGPLEIEVQVNVPTDIRFAVGKQVAAGRVSAFRPVTLKGVNTNGAAKVYTSETKPVGSHQTLHSQILDPVRYWEITTDSLNPDARIELTFGADDQVPNLSSLVVMQAPAANSSYLSLGGAWTGTAAAGTVESTLDLIPGYDFFTIAYEPTSDVGPDSTSSPSSFHIGSPMPNPFVNTTRISLSLPGGGPVRVSIFDVRGRLVRGLLRNQLPAGQWFVSWDGHDDSGARVASGTYLVRLEAGTTSLTRSVQVIR